MMKKVFISSILIAIFSATLVKQSFAYGDHTTVTSYVCKYFHNDEPEPFQTKRFKQSVMCPAHTIEPPTHTTMTESQLRDHAPDCIVEKQYVEELFDGR